ncbi:DUF3973 domain-containing protein [Paenibacillus sp. GCM10023248]|uniref:DUF3973 domain-containing protein n=1 Tax=Bacillales TaxID=1385 RepID=UPI00285A4BDD|nr:hypothetical protein [Bacillus sp. 3255]
MFYCLKCHAVHEKVSTSDIVIKTGFKALLKNTLYVGYCTNHTFTRIRMTETHEKGIVTVTETAGSLLF